MSAIRTNIARRQYLAARERERRIAARDAQQLAWKMKNLGMGSYSRPKSLSTKGRPIRSNIPVYKAPRPRYAKNISKNVTAQLKRSMDASELRIKSDRKKFNLRTNYTFQWRPSSTCASDVPDWFDIYPNRLLNNVHLAKTHATLQLGGPRAGEADYDVFQDIPGKVPTGYRELSQSFESCIVTGTRIQVDVEMPNNTTDFDEQYIMGIYFEKDGQFTPNQFVTGDQSNATTTKTARFASWASKNAVPNNQPGLVFDGDWIDANGIYDRNGETFTFLDFDRLPANFREMETTKKPATGAPTELMNYSKSNNPSSQTRCVKRFEFFWNLNSTGENINELIADTEPREVWKEDETGVVRPPRSSNQKNAGPYGHMFEKDHERNHQAQRETVDYHELNFFSNDAGYADNISVKNGFLEPSKGGIVRFVLFKKSGASMSRITMGKLNIQLDFSVLAFNKIEYDITRTVGNMPLIDEMCKSVSEIQPLGVPVYDDRRGDEEVEMDEAADLRGQDEVVRHDPPH
jgi:hypothetical protein